MVSFAVILALSSGIVDQLGLYILLFSAVLVGAFAFYGWMSTFVGEHAERIEEREKKSGGAVNSLAYFISAGQLYKLQAGAGSFCAVLTVATMLVFGVVNFVLLTVGAGVTLLMVAYLIRRHYVTKVQKRALQFQAQMLDFSMGLSNGLKSGQALPQALEVYAKNASEPLFGELRIVQREYHLGVDLAESLERMHRRIPCEDLQLMIVSIRLTMTSGGSLASVLEKMTATIRSRDDFHRKLAALTAQGRFEALAMSLAPVAAFLILMAVNPDLMIPLLTSTTGWIAIGIDFVLIMTGYTIIRKITNVEV